MAKQRKRPRFSQPPAGSKRPGIARSPDEVQKHEPLTWSLGIVDFGGEWGWDKLDPNEIEPLHAELIELEGKTLHELTRSELIKDIPAQHMVRRAQARLSHRGLEEHGTLWELRLTGKRRVWGLVERSVFRMLWWDPEETACHRPPKGQRRR